MGGLARLRAYRMSSTGQRWLERGVAAVGFGLLAQVLLPTGIVGFGGTGGTDATDYWIAARHVGAGEPLYAAAYGTYLAPPPPRRFAQLLAPVALLPANAFVWAWRLIELACLRVAVGGWRRAGIALLFPPVISELETGNVHLVMAAVCALAMRGAAFPVVPAGLLK